MRDIREVILYAIAVTLIIFMVTIPEKAKGDTLNATVGVGSKHFLPYSLNEDNGGIGVGYTYEYNKDIYLNIDYLKFTNSYRVPTDFIGVTVSYLPVRYKKFDIGIFGGIVHNNGYCGFYDVCKDNQETTDYLPIAGIQTELDNIVIKAMALPNVDSHKVDAIVWSISFKAIEF